MTSSPKKPGMAFWATVVVVVGLVYVLSIGPACWLTSRLNTGAEFVPIVYRPITLFIVGSNGHLSPAGRAIRWYSSIGAAPKWRWWRNPAGSNFSEWSDAWSDSGDSRY